MSQLTAIGSGPIRYFTSTGKQILVPLTAVTFDSSDGSVAVSSDYTQIQGAEDLLSWVQRLVQLGEIRPSKATAKQVALLLQSAFPGSWGNDARITVSYTSDTEFTLGVTVTNTWEGLTAATVKSVLGTATVTGSRPGIVRLLDADTPTAPDAATSIPLTGGADSPSPAASQATVSPTAFHLQAWRTGTAGDKTTASIAVTGSTFTLQAVWTNTVANVTTSNLLSTISSSFDHVLTASAPPGGVVAPQPGTFALGGGVDVGSAKTSLISR